MTDEERERSTLGAEILFEIAHSDFAKAYQEADKKLRSLEDKRDAEARVQEVIGANAEAPYPIAPKRIAFLERKYRDRIKEYSYNFYYADVFGNSSDNTWQPDVDRQEIIRKMVEKAPHKKAFRIVDEIADLDKSARLRRMADTIADIPKYVMYVAFGLGALLLLSIAADVLSYLRRAPTVRLIEKGVDALAAGVFTGAGLLACGTLLVLGFALRRAVQFLRRLAVREK